MPCLFRSPRFHFGVALLFSMSVKAEVYYILSTEEHEAMNKAVFECSRDYLKALKFETGTEAATFKDSLGPKIRDDNSYLVSSNYSEALTKHFGPDAILHPIPTMSAIANLENLRDPLKATVYKYRVLKADGTSLHAEYNKGHEYKSGFWSREPVPSLNLDFPFSSFIHTSGCGSSPSFSSLQNSGALKSCRRLISLGHSIKIKAPYSEDAKDSAVTAQELVSPSLEKCLEESDRISSPQTGSSSDTSQH